MHVRPGITHGADHPVERDEVLAIPPQRHLHSVDRFHRSNRVALDARHLHQAADRVAGQPKVMLQGNLGGIFQLRRRSAQHLGKAGSGHRTGRTYLALATNLGPGNRRILLAQDTDRRCRQQEVHHVRVARPRVELHVVMQHRRDDAGSTIGRCCDHAPAGGILFIHRKGEQVDPFHGTEGGADHVGLAQLLQAAMQPRRTALDVQPARQDAFITQAIVDAFTHGTPDPQQALAYLGLRAPGAFVGHHQLRHTQAMALAQGQQLRSAVELVRQHHRVRFERWRVDLGLLDDKTTAHRIVGLAQQAALPVHGFQAHGIGVIRQVLVEQQHVAAVLERQRVAAIEHQAVLLHHLANARLDGGRVDAVRPLAHQAEQAGAIGRMANPGCRQRPVQPHLDTACLGQQPLFAQGLGKGSRRPHRADGVGTGRPDADFEKVENTDSHANA